MPCRLVVVQNKATDTKQPTVGLKEERKRKQATHVGVSSEWLLLGLTCFARAILEV